MIISGRSDHQSCLREKRIMESGRRIILQNLTRAARKAILDKQRNEEVDETLECLEKLFALRYKQD